MLFEARVPCFHREMEVGRCNANAFLVPPAAVEFSMTTANVDCGVIIRNNNCWTAKGAQECLAEDRAMLARLAPYPSTAATLGRIHVVHIPAYLIDGILVIGDTWKRPGQTENAKKMESADSTHKHKQNR